jgi:hypothetical protein
MSDGSRILSAAHRDHLRRACGGRGRVFAFRQCDDPLLRRKRGLVLVARRLPALALRHTASIAWSQSFHASVDSADDLLRMRAKPARAPLTADERDGIILAAASGNIEVIYELPQTRS